MHSLIGLARWQYDRVHRGKSYDLELDASTATAMECAERINDKFHLWFQPADVVPVAPRLPSTRICGMVVAGGDVGGTT